MSMRSHSESAQHESVDLRKHDDNRRWHSVFARVGCSVIAGLIVGAAWREFLPAQAGLLGLGVFILVQSQLKNFFAATALALLTGFAGQLVACVVWLVSTASVLAGTGPLISGVLAAVICLYHSAVFVVFAIGYLSARTLTAKLAQLPNNRSNRRQEKRQRRRDRNLEFNSAGYRFARFFCHKTAQLSSWHLLLVPVVWGVAEFLTPTFYPFSMGCLLADDPALCQVAEFGGVYALSMFAVAISLGVPLAAVCARFVLTCEGTARSRSDLVLPAGVVVVVFFIGFWSHQRKTELDRQQTVAASRNEGLKLLMVQAETETSVANRRMIRASRKISGKADLVLWPEAALGNYNRELVDFSDTKTVAANAIGQKTRFRPFPNPGVFLLAGADTWANEISQGRPGQNFVSALLLDKQEQLVGRHDKVSLMPYGEYIPGEMLIPQIRDWLGSSRIISRGEKVQTIGEVKGQHLGVLLCCEDMEPELFRRLTKQNADVLVSLGNGMAFDEPLPLRQHFRISRLRAIENRRYFARCMSRGVSVLLSPTGEIVHQLPSMQDGAMLFEIPKLEQTSTLYTQFGNAPFLLFSCVYVIGWRLLAKRFT